MENATKALLIAAAVLIAILIISLGLVVYNSSAETVKSANLSQQEVQSANEKFARYNGKNKRGSEVNAMLQTVLNANVDATAAGENDRRVTVKLGDDTLLANNATSITTQADTSKLYDIEVKYGGNGGLVNEIVVTAHGTTTPGT